MAWVREAALLVELLGGRGPGVSSERAHRFAWYQAFFSF